jgi:hypothetical protein
VLYLMLCGKSPFKGMQASETLYRVLTETPPPVSAMRDDVPGAVESAMFKALAKKPDERYSTAAAFAEALREGRIRSEEEIAEEYASAVGKDFLGEMPAKLNLESLAVRDQGWREAQDVVPTAQRVPLSVPPPKLSSSSPPTLDAPVLIGPSTVPAIRTMETAVPPGMQRSRARRSVWLSAGGAAVLLAAGAATAVVVRRAPPPPAPSIVVVERQSGIDPSSAEPSAQPVASAQAAPIESVAMAPSATPVKSAAPSPAAAPAKTGSDAAALTRSFQRQQGRLDQCFARFANDVEGQPRIALRFSIDATGAVERADLNPASLAGTELGGCILAAARATQFGAQPEPVVFTIPITARRSK